MALTSNDWIAGPRPRQRRQRIPRWMFRRIILRRQGPISLRDRSCRPLEVFSGDPSRPECIRTTFAKRTDSDFYECMQRLQLVRAREPFAALAAQMICHYLHAIIDENLILQREASDFLNRYGRMGWPNALHVPIRRKRSIRSLLIDLSLQTRTIAFHLSPRSSALSRPSRRRIWFRGTPRSRTPHSRPLPDCL